MIERERERERERQTERGGGVLGSRCVAAEAAVQCLLSIISNCGYCSVMIVVVTGIHKCSVCYPIVEGVG